MSEVLTLTDYNGNAYTFPGSFWISDDPFSKNISVQKTFYSAGGRNISDSTINPRTVGVKGTLYANGGQTYEQQRTALMSAINKGGFLSRNFASGSNRFLEVVILDCAFGPEEGLALKDVELTFSCEFPLWQETTPMTDTTVVAGNDTLTIDNSLSEHIVKPVITITADQAANLPSVKMIQNSDGGMVFEYNDPSFLIGDVLEIDCEHGTVKRNGTDSIAFFKPARFLRLHQMINSINYEGGACTIVFTYRTVYL